MSLKIVSLLLVLVGLSLSQTVVQDEILRGSCKSVYLNYYSNGCSLPGVNSSMKLQVKVVQQFSTQKCTEGISYGLAQDNSYIWVAGLCYAEFAIYSVYNITTTAAPTTTTAAPTTTKAVVTASTAAPTTTTAAPNTTKAANATTVAPTTTKPANTSTNTSVNDICGKANSGFRIIGGTNATTCEYPWMAVLVDQVYQSVCGGSIIDSTHILTAAHCVVSTNYTTKSQVISPAVNLLVYTGSSTLGFLPNSNATRRYVVKVTPHEQYNDTTYDKDIAILTLSAPINFTTCQRPLCLVNATSSPQNSTQCRVMGWGVTSNALDAGVQTNLQWVDVPIVNATECKSKYGVYSTATNFCAGSLGKDSCQGDSGGPLACRESDGRYFVQGVVSAGLSGQCGTAVGLYTKVSSFIPWIQSKLTTV
ncbi:Serine protease 48 [Bulinus truncatus]|nr:Serine protease 48 [Bulinus truncatus]